MLRILLPAAAIILPLASVASGDAGAAGHDVGGSSPAAVIAFAASPADTESGDTPGDTPGDTVPVDTANPFLPEERDLTDCIGLLQRPGCGSEARGGLGQTLVAILMISGLVLIFGRVAWGLRRNRRRLEDVAAEATQVHDRAADRADGGADPGRSSDDAADVTTGRSTDAGSGDDAS